MNPPWKEQQLRSPKVVKNTITGWRRYPLHKKIKQIADCAPGLIPGMISLACLSVAMHLTSQYQVLIDGQVFAAVKDKQAIIEYVQEMDHLNRQAYGDEVTLLNDIQVARSFGLPVQDPEHLQVLLADRLQWATEAAVITVNGQEVVVLKDQATAESVLENIIQTVDQECARDFSSFKALGLHLAEDVQVVSKPVAPERLIDEQTAQAILLQGNVQQTRHIVSRGDTLSGIAVSRGVSLSTLTAANPDVQPTRLQIGQELNLTVAEPYVHVEQTAEVVKEEEIPFTTRYVSDSSLWSWQTQTVTAGKKGLKEVTSIVTLVNAQVIDEKVVGVKTIKEPSEAVVKQGTKKAAVQGTGNFIWPTNGTLTSGYGWRWGKFHRAVDIGAAHGTPIYAADAGVVTYSGWRTSYGYVVEIDHGNGYCTLYAHCSKLLVSRGQKVSKGQTIARIGSTGNSTGPHVHFEIKKNGSYVNPLNYFR